MKWLLVWFKTTFGDTWLSRMIEKGIASLDNSNQGLSGKKLTIITLMYCVVQMHEYWCTYAFARNDFSLFPIILGSDFATILALFGINEYGKKKNSITQLEQTESTTITDDTTTTQTDATNTQSTN